MVAYARRIMTIEDYDIALIRTDDGHFPPVFVLKEFIDENSVRNVFIKFGQTLQ